VKRLKTGGERQCASWSRENNGFWGDLRGSAIERREERRVVGQWNTGVEQNAIKHKKRMRKRYIGGRVGSKGKGNEGTLVDGELKP